jgi:hypothetical protein
MDHRRFTKQSRLLIVLRRNFQSADVVPAANFLWLHLRARTILPSHRNQSFLRAEKIAPAASILAIHGLKMSSVDFLASRRIPRKKTATGKMPV